MSNQFTKVYREEDELLRDCSYNVASIYFHLKNKRDFFKDKNNGTCYDCTRCISEYMGIPEITVKRAIATLKKIGLISATRQGTGMKRKNIYSFPILDKIEGITDTKEEIIPEEKTEVNNTNPENSMVEQEVEETFYEYCEEVGNFIESDEINIINNILKRAIDYIHFGKTEYEVFVKEGNNKIIEVANKYINLGDEKVWNDFNYYIKLYNTDYLNSMNDKLQEMAA